MHWNCIHDCSTASVGFLTPKFSLLFYQQSCVYLEQFTEYCGIC